MKKLRYLFLGELVAILASVAVGWAAGWRMPLKPWIAIPAGLVLWGCGFAFTLHLRRQMQMAREQHVRPPRHRGYPLVTARAAMHLGVALGTRSWPTLAVAVLCAAVNLGVAIRFRRALRDRFSRGPYNDE
jgi:protein-S-isoprenylcysteine O-methyltransferase Ste14